MKTNDLVDGFHVVADVENEIYEYEVIYGIFIEVCDRLSAKLKKLEKIKD